MSKEQKEVLADQIQRASDADIAKGMISKVTQELKNECMLKFADSSAHDSEGHQALNIYIKSIDDLRSRLESYVATGNLARSKLARLKEKEKRDV